MILIDDHCHLMHKLYTDVDAVIERAKKAGVKAIICSGVNPTTNRQALEIAKKYDIVRVSLGIYPVDALGLAPDESGLARQTEPIDLDEEFDFIKKNKDDIAAVGEVGLDYHWVKDAELQKKDGGALQLFKNNKIVKTIPPTYNTLTLFKVSPYSVHQVQEVTSKKKRLTFAGWFHG